MHVFEYAVLPAIKLPQDQVVQPPVLGEVETQASIYERIGGHELIEATLLSFLKKTSVDPKIQKWFGKVPQDINSGEMRSLMIIGFGGPNHEESLALKESWTPFLPEGLSKNDFSTMLNLFSDAMRGFDVADGIITEVINNLSSLRDVVVA